MARDHARIKTAIWIDDDFLDLSRDAQHLYLLVVTQLKLSFCGVFEWRPLRIAKLAMGWTVPEVEATAIELSKALYLVFDQDSEEVIVRSFIRNDGLLSSPNITKAMLRDYSNTSSRDLRAVVVHELKRMHSENPRFKGWEVCGMLLDKRSVDPSELPVYDPRSNPLWNPSITPSIQSSETAPSNPIDTPYSLLPTPLLPTPNSPPKKATYTEQFETAWSLYPLKTSKKTASASFEKALKEIQLEDLLDAITRYRDDPNRESKFTKHFSTWLNQGCWEDDPLPAKQSGSDQRLARGYQMAQQLQQRPAPSNEFPTWEPDDYQMELEP